MCGRFTLHTSSSELVRVFQLIRPPTDVVVRWNIAPTQQVLAVRQSEQGREPVWMRWGLIPSWAKDAKIGNSLINARAETISEKPSFRTAFKRRRCLVIADGFYEWSKFEKAKVPYLIKLRSRSTFAFAGLWEQWKEPTGDWIESTTIITTNPNSLMASIHDRMPVILPSERYDEWLNVSTQDVQQLQKLLIPYPPEDMETEKVSSAINNARNEVDPRIA
jgi:putative SOS response-associated peptidase YedK